MALLHFTVQWLSCILSHDPYHERPSSPDFSWILIFPRCCQRLSLTGCSSYEVVFSQLFSHGSLTLTIRGWLVTVVFWPFAHGSLVSHTNLFESSFPSRLSCSWFSWLHHERLPILTAFLHLTSSWFSLGGCILKLLISPFLQVSKPLDSLEFKIWIFLLSLIHFSNPLTICWFKFELHKIRDEGILNGFISSSNRNYILHKGWIYQHIITYAKWHIMCVHESIKNPCEMIHINLMRNYLKNYYSFSFFHEYNIQYLHKYTQYLLIFHKIS